MMDDDDDDDDEDDVDDDMVGKRICDHRGTVEVHQSSPSTVEVHQS